VGHYYGGRLRAQGRGGVVLLMSIGSFQGMPCAAPVEFSRWEVNGLAAAPGPARSGFATRARMRMDHTLDPVPIAQP
jgi:uncharacterized protein